MAQKRRHNKKVPEAEGPPLFLVTGLPSNLNHLIKPTIEKLYEYKCDVINIPSVVQDYSIYNESYVSLTINALTDFVLKRRNEREKYLNPSKIIVFYVPAKDAEKLLEKLDFAVFPVAMGSLAIWDDVGKMMRHDVGKVADSLKEAIAFFKACHHHFDRIRLLRSTDPIILPPVNFRIDKILRMKDFFHEMRTGKRDWKDRFTELEPIEYTFEEIPNLKNKTGKFFKDSRDVVFYQPHETAFHGNTREVDDDENEEGDLRKLRSLYRFGAPLPQGFQHDAQYERGQKMHNLEFICARNGQIFVTDSHADVYPNDFVRHRSKK